MRDFSASLAGKLHREFSELSPLKIRRKPLGEVPERPGPDRATGIGAIDDTSLLSDYCPICFD